MALHRLIISTICVSCDISSVTPRYSLSSQHDGCWWLGTHSAPGHLQTLWALAYMNSNHCLNQWWHDSSLEIITKSKYDIEPSTHQADVIKWKHFPRYWPFVRGIYRSPVNSPHKGQWRGALVISLICVWMNDWANHPEAGDLRRYRAHYDVTVMHFTFTFLSINLLKRNSWT